MHNHALYIDVCQYPLHTSQVTTSTVARHRQPSASRCVLRTAAGADHHQPGHRPRPAAQGPGRPRPAAAGLHGRCAGRRRGLRLRRGGSSVLLDRRLRRAGPLTWASQCSSERLVGQDRDHHSAGGPYRRECARRAGRRLITLCGSLRREERYQSFASCSHTGAFGASQLESGWRPEDFLASVRHEHPCRHLSSFRREEPNSSRLCLFGNADQLGWHGIIG
jgi:hypothetical protein